MSRGAPSGSLSRQSSFGPEVLAVRTHQLSDERIGIRICVIQAAPRRGDEKRVCCNTAGGLEVRPTSRVHCKRLTFAGTPLIFAGLVLCLAPIAIWHLKTGIWALQQFEIEYYLQLAAQAYYNHRWFISDPLTEAGVTLYPWLQFVPAANLARSMDLSAFGIGVVWAIWASVAVSLTLYLVFWRFLRSTWLSAGLTIFCISDRGFCRTTPGVAHVKTLISALFLTSVPGSLNIPLIPLLQWRILNPALDLPFLFIQIVALSVARNSPTRLHLWLSALAFGILFYVYFYVWTLVFAALCLAMLLDSAMRKVYLRTLLIGLAIERPNWLTALMWRRLLLPKRWRDLVCFCQSTRPFSGFRSYRFLSF